MIKNTISIKSLNSVCVFEIMFIKQRSVFFHTRISVSSLPATRPNFSTVLMSPLAKIGLTKFFGRIHAAHFFLLIGGRFYLEDALSIWTNYLPLCVVQDEQRRRTTEDSSSRRIMRLVPVFILETHNPSNNKCLPKFAQTDNAPSCIKTAIF